MSWRASAALGGADLSGAGDRRAGRQRQRAVSIPLRALPALLWGEPAPDQVLWRNVLIDIRLPRVLFAVVAGRAWPCPAPPCRRCSAIRWPSRA